jgi:hypothetical protein
VRFNRLRLKLGTFHMLRPDADSHEARGQPRQERQRLEDSRGKQTPHSPTPVSVLAVLSTSVTSLEVKIVKACPERNDPCGFHHFLAR